MPDLPVYLDCQSTTPMDPRVTTAVVESFQIYGNPHGRQHRYGQYAADAVEEARNTVACLIGAYPQRIIFTSGATESCNLALRGAAVSASTDRRRIVTVATEHPAVLETVRELGQSGFETVILPVDSDGLVDLEKVEDAVDDSTLIVSVMAVNNEIGVIQPVSEIASICHAFGALFHTDATQAPGRIEVNVNEWEVDLLTFSSHKVYGPKGIGALYVADDAMLAPLQFGGGQERGFRPGTVPTPLACGFGEAAAILIDEWSSDVQRMERLSGKLWDGLERLSPNFRRFGSISKRAPGNLSFGFPGISGDKVVAMVESEIAISTGSACASHGSSVSHVLEALGCSHAEASTGVRVGLGRFTTEADIDVALTAFERIHS